MVSAGGKVACVTGAARGIGLAVARKFHSQGYQVALLDIDVATLMRSATTLEGAMALACDVSDPAQVRSSIDQVAAAFGRIDALETAARSEARQHAAGRARSGEAPRQDVHWAHRAGIRFSRLPLQPRGTGGSGDNLHELRRTGKPAL